MKLATLLTQYLYAHHRLDLPGIGSFALDPTMASLLATARPNQLIPDGIRFEYNPALTDATELIAYISAQTGKMKALASADLESHIQLAHQFLNIGKPFHFEGIGTLTRIKAGEFEFIADPLQAPDRKKEGSKDSHRAVSREEQIPKYESFLTEKKPKEGWRKPVIMLLAVLGLGLAIWGGYAISKNSRKDKSTTQQETPDSATSPETPVTDGNTTPADSSAINTTTSPGITAITQNGPQPVFKYILETAQEKRALKRYYQLRAYLWDVKLETQDSVSYKLYVMLPTPQADTSRVIDSLSMFLGRPVYIERSR